MYSFEGDFRRKPKQNLGGASASRKTTRADLILQSQQQRQKREEHRKQLLSSIKIQAYVRSYLTRKHHKDYQREIFDILFSKSNLNDEYVFSTLTTKILFFFEEKKDILRLVSVSQVILKQWRKVFQSRDFSIQIRRLLALHLRLLRNDLEVPVAVPLRMFEVFTSINSNERMMSYDEAMNFVASTFVYVIKRGYFKDIRRLMCQRTPPLYGPSPNPPTPLSGVLLELIQRPLSLIPFVNVTDYSDMVMREFTATYLCTVYSEPVELYVLPALAQDTAHPFPFLALVKCLRGQSFLNVEPSEIDNDSWLLHSVLALEPNEFAQELQRLDTRKLPNNPHFLDYLEVIATLTVNVCNKHITYDFEDSLYSQETAADKDDDSDSEREGSVAPVREQALLARCVELLNEPARCMLTACAQVGEVELCEQFLDAMSRVCHNLLLSHKLALHKYRLLYTLAFKPTFVRELWMWLSAMSYTSSFGGTATPLLAALSRGIGTEAGVGVRRLLAPLSTFCALFTLLIGTLHDTEFFRDSDDTDKIFAGECSSSTSEVGGASTSASAVAGASTGATAPRVHAFDFSELDSLCRALRPVCLGLVELAFPETRPGFAAPHHTHTPAWTHLFKVFTQLVRALHERDARLHFCSGSWVTDGDTLASPDALRLARPPRARFVPPHLSQEEGPPLTIKELRTVTILIEIPFVVPFATRVLIFQALLVREKHEHWYELTNFNEGPLISIIVRRTHLYEDAFEKLSPENEPDLKLKLRVQLINQAGAEEPGVDGGGLFREFLSELLKSAFDPNRGLFRLTKDNMLYPNPGVHLLYDDFPMHYYFVGRMLGKALYESLLVDLPFAEFFLAKLCSSREADVHALASLDPGLHRGLLLLRAHNRRGVPDLGLDFTVLTDHLGEQRIEELKPGGANIPVTAENRIEYIHLIADYKLNRQIRSQCAAFKRGLTSVVNGDWLRMFSCKELQLLISGAEVPIDLEDMKKYTQYGGGFFATHPTVQSFWNVMQDFTDDQRRQLLKFVTSCSRPPLLGFKDLQPPFCIQSAGLADRLPSASTCMNLLKLPEFPSQEMLAERLLYAIQAGAGFELS